MYLYIFLNKYVYSDCFKVFIMSDICGLLHAVSVVWSPHSPCMRHIQINFLVPLHVLFFVFVFVKILAFKIIYFSSSGY